MRIQDDLNSRDINRKSKKTAERAGASKERSFAKALEETAAELDAFEGEASALKDQIDDAGSALDNDPSPANYERFRDLIGALTKKVSSEAYRYRKVGVTHSQPDGYQIVQTINQELDQLYRLIMREQKDRIAITNKIVRLKGLVVNVLS